MDELLGFLGWLLVDVILINTGRVVVRLVTLGRWRGERLGGKEARTHGLAGALSFKREGWRVVTATGLLFVGLAFYVVLGLLLLAV